MSQKMTRFEKINIANIILTLILSAIAVFLSYNSYKISENTFTNSEKIDKLNNTQSEFELKNSILSLINTASMLSQNEAKNPDISKCIRSFTEMKYVLESQVKNYSLIQRKKLAELWTDLLMDINFNIKFFELGLKKNTVIEGASEMILKVSEKIKILFDTFSSDKIVIENE